MSEYPSFWSSIISGDIPRESSCKKQKLIISITGQGQYCYDCHNKMVMDEYGMPDTFKYARTMSVMEPTGELYTFEENHIILGDIVSWEAIEQQGGYEFKGISDIEDNGTEVAKRFFKKIVDGVCMKTLDHWGLKDKGVILIDEDEDNDFSPVFKIDGKKFTPEDLGQLAKGYAGFVMHYQIHDASDPLLSEHDYLVPVRITKEGLIADFEKALSLESDNGFLKSDNVPAFFERLAVIIDKLKIVNNAGDRDYAKEMARELAHKLSKVPTDNEFFPFNEIWAICDAVDSRGTDDELWGYLEDL